VINNTEFVARVRVESITSGQLGRDLPGQILGETALDIDLRQFLELRFGLRLACELTDTYSPAAMDMAPATRPATPATRICDGPADAVATPMIKLAVETIPSFAPRTAARSQPMREIR
jgi:hypothetical protein